MELFAGGGLDGAKAHANDCPTLLRLLDDGYSGFPDERRRLIESYANDCRTIAAFQEVQPAKRSFVRDFVFDDKAICYLPALMFVDPSCDATCQQFHANEEGVPIAAFLEEYDLRITDAHHIDVQTFDSWLTLLMGGRGDFDGDELDDILVSATTILRGAMRGPSATFILTRESSDAILRVVEPEQYLCDSHGCSPPEAPTPLLPIED